MSTLLKNRFMVSTIAFSLLMFALVVLVIVPALKEIRLINEQVLEERIRLETLYTKGQIQRTVLQNYNSIKDEIGFLDAMLLKENEELRYITAVESLADEIGVDLAISIGEPKRVPEQSYSELEFVFALTGDWERALNWIDRVEQLPYYTNMNELTIAVHDAENTGRAANITIGATTYWLIPTL